MIGEPFETYNEPVKALSEYKDRANSGMSDYELSFLCGALRKWCPRKILELGVSAGGTSVVIMECLKLLDYDCELISVDISKMWYKDSSKKTGFVIDEWKEKNPECKVTQKTLLGRTVAGYSDEIGAGVDFVVLDTMHSLPGEMLDYISVLPMMQSGGVCCFHDVAQAQFGFNTIDGAPLQFASLTTLLVSDGTKYFGNDKGRIGEFANIGAIEITEDTIRNVDNIFLGLYLDWGYIPDIQCMDEYRKHIKNMYRDGKFIEILDRAYRVNRYSLYKRKGLKCSKKKIYDGLVQIKKKDHVYIYGHGNVAGVIQEFLTQDCSIGIDYVVTNPSNGEIGIDDLSMLIKEDDVIILGVSDIYQLEVIDEIYSRGLENYIFPRDGIGMREMVDVVKFENELNHDIEDRNSDPYFSQIWESRNVKN